jgi:hypothetical protein
MHHNHSVVSIAVLGQSAGAVVEPVLLAKTRRAR